MSKVELKYVMVCETFPVLFVAAHEHSSMRAIGLITSAGFFRHRPDGSIETYGRSHSLNLGPAPEDAQIIALFFGGKS